MIWQILFGLALALAFLAIRRVGVIRVDLIQAERETAAWHKSWLEERQDNVSLRVLLHDHADNARRPEPMFTAVPVTEPNWLNVGGTPSEGGSIVTASVG